jgi:hypothetical protein
LDRATIERGLNSGDCAAIDDRQLPRARQYIDVHRRILAPRTHRQAGSNRATPGARGKPVLHWAVRKVAHVQSLTLPFDKDGTRPLRQLAASLIGMPKH